MSAFKAGQGAAVNGGVAPPRQQTHQKQNEADYGYRVGRSPPPPPPPRDTTRR